jgi:hypothetical protein
LPYAFTSTATFTVFDGELVRDTLTQLPGLNLLKGGPGADATSSHLCGSRFRQLNSSGAGNSGNDEERRDDGEGGKLYRPLRVGPLTMWIEWALAGAKPNFGYQQRINDAFNTGFISKHNLGFASFLRCKGENGFLIQGELSRSSTRSWEFASGAAWTTAAKSSAPKRDSRTKNR